MVERIPDLKVDYKVYYETLFVVSFFAINVTLSSSVIVTQQTSGHQINSNFERTMFMVSYCVVSTLYIVSYLAYVNILQAVWSYQSEVMFHCPILDRLLPLPVYIRNRQLIRHK